MKRILSLLIRSLKVKKVKSQHTTTIELDNERCYFLLQYVTQIFYLNIIITILNEDILCWIGENFYCDLKLSWQFGC